MKHINKRSKFSGLDSKLEHAQLKGFFPERYIRNEGFPHVVVQGFIAPFMGDMDMMHNV